MDEYDRKDVDSTVGHAYILPSLWMDLDIRPDGSRRHACSGKGQVENDLVVRG